MKKYLMPYDVWSKLSEHVANANDRDFLHPTIVNEFIYNEYGLIDLDEAVFADPEGDYDDKEDVVEGLTAQQRMKKKVDFLKSKSKREIAATIARHRS